VRCTACATELLPGKKFCHVCGTPAAARCRSCGAPLEPAFRFCPDCGAPAPAGADDRAAPADDPLARLSQRIPPALARKVRDMQGVIEGERKQVTVLFCDLAGSTAIAELLDPEEYHDVLEQYLALAFGEIYRFEGIVNHIAGDGLMAIFGAPVAHEDAPQRAVLAALAIQEALGRFDPPVLAARGLALEARIGIHTGPVVVGTVGSDLKMDYTAIGDTTNLAARLESLAAPGTILLSEAAHRLVRGLFQVRPAGPFEVKGKRDPVAAYEVIGPNEATPMAVAAERGLTPFVGRREELAQLESGWRRAATGGVQVVAVVGEAGSGKSRLVYELKQRVAAEPGLFLEGRCSTLGQSVPYFPFVTMFRHYFGLRGDEAPASACAKVVARVGAWRGKPELTQRLVARLLALPLEKHDGEGEDVKRESFDAIAQLLLAESERAPVVLVIEDLHCIDDASRELLEHLVGRLADARLLLIVTQRPDEQPPWRARAALTQLVLHRLRDDEVRDIVRAVAGAPLPVDLERLLVARAEGSPFFAEETTRALLEEGHLVVEDGRARVTRPVEDVRIPGTIQEVIAARLDSLSPPAKRVVQVAAVLGRQFHGRDLAEVLAGEAIDVPSALADLERRGLFHRKTLLGSDEYRFGESLTQEVAYESLLLKQRRQLHERVARRLEAAPGEPTAERSALLAHHFARSDDRRRALAALLRAGEDAERLPSYRTAAEFYRQAWELAEAALDRDADPEARRTVLAATTGFCRVTVLFGLPYHAEAERAAERGRELAQALGDWETLSSLCYFQGAVMMLRGRDHFGRGLELAEQGLAVAAREGLGTATLRLSRGLAINYVLDGRFDLARRTIRWVLEETARGGASMTSDLALSSRWVRDVVLYLSDDLDEALRTTPETYAAAVAAPNRTVRSGAAGTLAHVHFMRGGYAEAKRWADESLEIAEAIGNPGAFPAAAAVALVCRLELGEPVDAARYVELMEQGLVAGGSPQMNIRFVGDALLALDDVERLERYTAQVSGRLGGKLREAMVAEVVGHVMVRLRRFEEAERRYREAIGLAETIGARSSLAAAHLGAAELAVQRGRDAAAARHLERALALCRELRLGRYEARAARLTPRLAGARGADPEPAPGAG
jgi:class 3 adenylate cyclase/tetratricopeptide (TPR) repeat protein